MSKNVVIIDDDESIREVVTMIVDTLGYQTISLPSCKDPKEILGHKPQLVIMDLWMPGVGGEELTTKLKKNNATKDIPILIMSASNEAKKVADRIGADGCLLKPFDIDELEQVVHSYLL